MMKICSPVLLFTGRKPVEPLHPYYFLVKTRKQSNAKCTYKGPLWIPSAEDDIHRPMINDNFKVIAKCDAMKEDAWYIIQHPGKMLTTERPRIAIRKSQYIIPLRSGPAKRVNKFYKNRPYEHM